MGRWIAGLACNMSQLHYNCPSIENPIARLHAEDGTPGTTRGHLRPPVHVAPAIDLPGSPDQSNETSCHVINLCDDSEPHHVSTPGMPARLVHDTTAGTSMHTIPHKPPFPVQEADPPATPVDDRRHGVSSSTCLPQVTPRAHSFSPRPRRTSAASLIGQWGVVSVVEPRKSTSMSTYTQPRRDPQAWCSSLCPESGREAPPGSKEAKAQRGRRGCRRCRTTTAPCVKA